MRSPRFEPNVTAALNAFRRTIRQMAQLRRLPAMQPGRNGERRVHSNHAAIEVQLRHALKTSCRTFLDANAAAFTVVDQNLVQAVRTRRSRDARLRANQVT